MRHKTNPQEHQRLRRLLRIRQISAKKGRSGRSNLSTLSWFSLDKRKKKRKPGKSNWGWFKRNKALYEGEHARPLRKVKPVLEQVADALQVVPDEARQRMYRGVQSVHSKRTTLAPFLKAPSL